jgi:hypothetical protein
MTILAIHTGDNLTKDMYENVRKEVNWEGNTPAGVIFHAAYFDKSGNFSVAEVWESEDQWNNFFKHSPETFYAERQCTPSKDTNISNLQNRCFTRT